MATRTENLAHDQARLEKLEAAVTALELLDDGDDISSVIDDELARLQEKQESLAEEVSAQEDRIYEAARRIPTYELSENQELFVRDAIKQDLDVTYDYSGRCMGGETCPSVRVDGPGEFGTKAGFRSDSMGLGIVIYAPY